MNKLVKSACEYAIAVKSRMNNPTFAQGHAPIELVEQVMHDVLVSEFKAYADISSAASSISDYGVALGQWRDMVAYNSSLIAAVIKWAKRTSPKLARSRVNQPIWDMVDLPGIAKSLLDHARKSSLRMMADEIIVAMVLKDLFSIILMHAADQNSYTEERLANIVVQAYGVNSVQELNFLLNPKGEIAKHDKDSWDSI